MDIRPARTTNINPSPNRALTIAVAAVAVVCCGHGTADATSAPPGSHSYGPDNPGAGFGLHPQLYCGTNTQRVESVIDGWGTDAANGTAAAAVRATNKHLRDVGPYTAANSEPRFTVAARYTGNPQGHHLITTRIHDTRRRQIALFVLNDSTIGWNIVHTYECP